MQILSHLGGEKLEKKSLGHSTVLSSCGTCLAHEAAASSPAWVSVTLGGVFSVL